MKVNIKRIDLIRTLLLVGAVALILFVLPREDHQSYSYQAGQPWRYQLLTAEVSFPVFPDSTTSRRIRDSIERSFIPFVRLDEDLSEQNIERFRKAVEGIASPQETSFLTGLLRQVYKAGIIDAKTYQHIKGMQQPKVRVFADSANSNEARTMVASDMRSPSKAFDFIDSLYSETAIGGKKKPLEGEVAKSLNVCLLPNYISDPEVDGKYRNNEYVLAEGGRGVFQKGERIVDRGEIITPQIYTNLNTYFNELAKIKGEDTKSREYSVGKALYIFIWFLLLYFYLATYRKRFYASEKKMVFLISFISLFVVFAILMFEWFTGGLFVVPFAAIPVMILVFFDTRTAIFSLIVAVMISALVAVDQLVFIFFELFAGLVAAFSIQQLTQRSQLLRTALFTFLAYSVAYLVMLLVVKGELQSFEWRVIGKFAINAVILSFTYVLILVIERVFGFTSMVTLVELSDINNKILRRLAEEAPGTFQHSMQVSTLASEAARAIGANTQLVRTGALYHDIGKMESPVFFTENQHGINPHEGLNPETSAQKIISHVTGGLALATKWKLPKVIRDFISEHHGKSVTRYFYNTAVNENPGKVIDRSRFQYPGPNPQSKETAILMMADAVEAASRSLKDYTPASINALVDKIIDGQQADGLFKEAPISYKDVEKVKDTFKKRLATIYHSRIAYPELHGKGGQGGQNEK